MLQKEKRLQPLGEALRVWCESASSPESPMRITLDSTVAEDWMVESDMVSNSSAPASPAKVEVDEELTCTDDMVKLSPAGSTPPGVFLPFLPSAGSIYHASGKCKPCGWFWKPGGCTNGRECKHCHLCPRGEVRARMHARKKAKAAIALIEESSKVGDHEESICEPGEQDVQEVTAIAVKELPSTDKLHICVEEQSDASTAEGQVADSESAPGSPVFAADHASLEVAISPPPGLMPPPPGVLLPCLSSVGSVHHSSGTCKPCGWFWKAGGCTNGQKCNHCHLCPRGAARVRRKSRMTSMQEHQS